MHVTAIENNQVFLQKIDDILSIVTNKKEYIGIFVKC